MAQYPDRETEYDAYEARKTVAAAQRKFKQARTSAYRIVKMAQNDSLPEYILPALKEIADYSKAIGDLSKAYAYAERYTHYKDSLDRQQTAFKMNELELRYQSAQKEQQIQELQSKSDKQKLMLWGTALLLLLIILFFLYRFQQKKIQNTQQVQSMEQQRQIEVTQALLTGEETERSRLARDLHDGLGGMLAGVKLHLSQIAEQQPQLHRAIDQLGDSVNELRRIAKNMIPESLLRSGLEVALRELCDSIVSIDLRVVFHAFQIRDDISSGTQLTIYRIVQELLGNAVKHAAASKIIVQCSQAEDTFFITVEDNGKGFDASCLHQEGMGFKNIRSRVDFLKGNMHIDSSTDGTIINIEVNVAS
ncbi:hypothetical protein GCM10023231_29300 [Olivibacter ginsenosidimutans]|uniref:Histidine kinase domain-containing protein n=1 Tax=Olivibacter ginsenosidimutans TaxID=1176537 RepID=A0ABP9BU25_9SPHI